MAFNFDPRYLKFYLVINEEYAQSEADLAEIHYILQNGITCCQVRFKTISDKKFIKIATKIRDWCKALDILFILNDRYWLVKKLQADGIHIGQGDEKYKKVRSVVGEEAVIGISANTEAQILAAVSLGADYLGIGAIYPTNSKADAKLFQDYGALSKITIPYVMIGGINDQVMPELIIKYHPNGFAMIEFLLSNKENINKIKNFSF